MPRPRERDNRIYWKRGRAYADFRDFRHWGGKREALKKPGTGVTTDDVCYEQGDRIVACEEVFADALRDGEMTVEEYDQLSDSERLERIKAHQLQTDIGDRIQEAGE